MNERDTSIARVVSIFVGAAALVTIVIFLMLGLVGYFKCVCPPNITN